MFRSDLLLRISVTEEKKREFFAYLSPMIAEVNFGLAEDRDRVRKIREAYERGVQPTWAQRRWLARLAGELDLDFDSLDLEVGLAALERRAGVVPESIVLVQAALESGWGTSRFALEGNNYFGQRCYRDDCGMEAGEAPDGSQFGLAKFDSAEASVQSYIRNLNTHPSYRQFRALRLERRNSGQPITGLSLVDGLINYSERGSDYVSEVAAMIRANDLE